MQMPHDIERYRLRGKSVKGTGKGLSRNDMGAGHKLRRGRSVYGPEERQNDGEVVHRLWWRKYIRDGGEVEKRKIEEKKGEDLRGKGLYGTEERLSRNDEGEGAQLNGARICTRRRRG